MQCPNGCAEAMVSKKQSRLIHRGKDPIVICDLIVNVCPSCGQESIPLESARVVEKVLQGKAKPSGRFTAERYEVDVVTSS